MNERDDRDRAGISTADIAGTSERMSSPDQSKTNDPHREDGSNVTAMDRGKGATINQPSSSTDSVDESPLLPNGESYRSRWQEIQGTFVDDPRDSVSKADGLVAEVIQTLAKRFAEERQHLEQDWSGGRDPSTEDLRKALQHYRSFFQRLLAA
jgi:hypothetical protein